MTGVRRFLLALLLISILSVPAIGTAQAAPLDQGSVYVVKAGDSLSAIAQQYGVSMQAIMAANNISNSSLIYAGQRLVIPGTDAPPHRFLPIQRCTSWQVAKPYPPSLRSTG